MNLLLISLVAMLGQQNSAPDPVDYLNDIRPVMETKCLRCHMDGGVAFSLEDVERGYDFRAAMAGAVAAKRMPPWMAEPGHQRYINDYSLTARELGLFAQWSAAGYPKGQLQEKSSRDEVQTGAFRPDFRVELPGTKNFLPDQTQRDDYHCFVARWPLQHEAYVTGFGLTPGNASVSHHAIIYVAPPNVEGVYREFVEDEGGQGYKCLGGTLPDRLATGAAREKFEKTHPEGVAGISRNQLWLAHWAPGMEGYDLPEGTGIRVAPGSVLIVQMHYFNGFAPNERDHGTQLGFRTRRSVAMPSFNWPMSRGEWLQARANQSLVVPPKGKLTVSDSVALAGLDDVLAILSKRPVSDFDGFVVHSANLHMHLIGAAGQVTLTQAGEAQVLLSVPRYQFGWQRDFFFAEPKRIDRKGLGSASVQYSCTFSNPGDEPVYGGFGSNEEMCYNFSYISLVPRQPSTSDAGAVNAK